jgi:Hpt domain.
MNVGQEVFDLQFKEDKKFKKELHQSLIQLDFLFQESITKPIDQMENSQFKDKVKELKKRESFSDNIYQLKLNLHTIKGISRSIGEREISEYVHTIENGIQILTQSENLSKDKFHEILRIPQNKVFQFRKSLYFKQICIMKEISDP